MVLTSDLIVILLTAIVSVGMGTIVLLRDRLSATHLSFSAFTIIISAWSITNYFSLHSETADITLFWIRAVMAVTSYLGVTLFFFLYSYPKRKLTLSPLITLGLLAAATIVSIISFTPYLFSSVAITNGNITPKPGPGFLLFILVFIPPIIAGFVSLLAKYRRSFGTTRLQIRYLFLGSALTFTLLIFTNIILAIFIKSSQLVFLGPASSLIMLGFIFYAIMKHRLLNISGLIARAVSYAILVGFLSSLYALVLFSGARYIYPHLFDNPRNTIITSTVVALIFALTLPKLRETIESVTDKFLYKNHFIERNLFDKLAGSITSTFDLDILAQSVTNLLQKELRVRYAKIVLQQKDSYIFFQSAGTHGQKLTEVDMTDLTQFYKSTIVFDELDDGELKEWMRRFELSVIQKMEVRGETIGYLLLGGKASGDIFYENELVILPTISDQLAVAFENALAVRQINQFNLTLKDEVDKATSDLQRANEDLKALDKLKDEFVSLASHELKSPMNAIKNYLWLAQNKGKQDPAKMDEYLTVAYNATQRLIALVNDLLDVSRIESGRVELTIVPLNLNQIVKETVAIFQPQADEKGLIIKVDLDSAPSPKGDDAKVREVISNLLSNAIKYTPHGSVTLNAKPEGAMVKFMVTDTGLGITTEDQAHLFAKFVRVNKSYKELAMVEGTGLGLYICKKYLELMGGEIGLDSTMGKGSTFWFKLPQA